MPTKKKTSASFSCHGWVNVCFVKLRKDNNPDGGQLLDPDNQQGAIHPKTPQIIPTWGRAVFSVFQNHKTYVDCLGEVP